MTENETWVKEFEIEITKKNSELEKVNKESEAAQAELETIRESMHGNMEDLICSGVTQTGHRQNRWISASDRGKTSRT